MEKTMRNDALPSLGDPAIVDQLVRQFAARVFDIRSAFFTGEPGADEPLVDIEADARRMGAIFLGRDVAYDLMPWNSDNCLGMYLKVLFPEESMNYGDPCTGAFMWLAYQIAQAAHAVDQGMDVRDAHRELDPIIADLVARLLRGEH
jgi:hypothetical protein